MKKCTRCLQTKDSGEFYGMIQTGKNGQRWRYLDSMCKSCRSNYTSERRRTIKLQAIEYLGGACKDCGIIDSEPSIYDFHHEGDKDYAIGQNTKSFENIIPELKKCTLLCANCHRRRHAFRYPSL